jgi:hypothetical protein
VVLEWTMNLPSTPDVRRKRSYVALKGRPILAFLWALVGTFKAGNFHGAEHRFRSGFIRCDKSHW